MNKVILFGNLGKNPELKTTKTGKNYCNLSVATSESYKDEKGEWQSKSTWHNVTVWEGKAKYVCDKGEKGSRILVEGKLSTREYEKDGQKKYITEVIASSVNLVQTGSNNNTQSDSLAGNDDLPF